MENWNRDQTGEKNESVTKVLKKHESMMKKGLRAVRKNGGGGGWIEKSARRAGGGETKTCGAKSEDTCRPASERREKDRKEVANSFGVSLEGARQKRERRGAEQKQSGDFQQKTRVGKNQYVLPHSAPSTHTTSTAPINTRIPESKIRKSEEDRDNSRLIWHAYLTAEVSVFNMLLLLQPECFNELEPAGSIPRYEALA